MARKGRHFLLFCQNTTEALPMCFMYTLKKSKSDIMKLFNKSYKTRIKRFSK